MPVIKRFQIEELIVQDAFGVVFRASDTETGKTVAIHRFFPFGAFGGGLPDHEQGAYHTAVGRLAGLSHPAFRAVVCGGCDPIDGMPFIVTEWMDGVPLQSLIGQGIPTESATLLISQALEVCELLSHSLTDEAVWVETESHGIIVCPPESGRGFVFSISPFKWLDSTMESRGLESISALTDEVMGWTGQVVNDQAGQGLGGWLKWLRGSPSGVSLREARETLAASVGAEPPPPTTKLVEAAMLPQARPSFSKSRQLVAIIIGLLALGGVAGWLLARNEPPVPQASANDRGHAAPVAEVNRRAAELSALAAQADLDDAAILAAQETATAKRGGAIAWDDHELLVAKNKQPVEVEGVVKDTATSSTGKTAYLLFAGESERDAARAGMSTGEVPLEAILKQFKPFIGKKVRVSGTVKLLTGFGLNRPDIIITDISAVRIVK